VSDQLHTLTTLPPGERIPEPVWTQWWREKFPAPAVKQTLLIQPVA